MQANIMKVKSCSEQFYVKSEKADNGQMAKRNLVLQEIGGKFENSYLVAVFGNLAGCQFYEGDVVITTLRFSTREYNGQVFQDIVATDIIKINR